MSQENVELVRRGFDAFNRRGRDARASEAVLAPDVVWEVALGVPGFDGVYRGRAEVRRFWLTWMADFAELRLEVDEIVDAGGHVFAAVLPTGRGRRSGIEVTGQMTFPVFTVRDGLIVRYQLFAEREQALKAAGLRE